MLPGRRRRAPVRLRSLVRHNARIAPPHVRHEGTHALVTRLARRGTCHEVFALERLPPPLLGA
eukprot:1387980-Prymnesium_polylepis.1